MISYEIGFFPTLGKANAEDTRSVVWNHVETYTVNMTPRAYTLEHFRNRNLSIIISFLDHQPLLVLTSTNTCSQQLDKLLTSLVFESEVGLTAYDTARKFLISWHITIFADHGFIDNKGDINKLIQ